MSKGKGAIPPPFTTKTREKSQRSLQNKGSVKVIVLLKNKKWPVLGERQKPPNTGGLRSP